jgi:hypothetical protein
MHRGWIQQRLPSISINKTESCCLSIIYMDRGQISWDNGCRRMRSYIRALLGILHE